AHDKSLRAPRLGSECLKKLHAALLILEKQRLRIIQRDRSRKQLLGLEPKGIDHRFVDVAEVQSRAAAEDLCIEGWLAVHEGHGEAESRIERARGSDVASVQLRFGSNDCGHEGYRYVYVGAL